MKNVISIAYKLLLKIMIYFWNVCVCVYVYATSVLNFVPFCIPNLIIMVFRHSLFQYDIVDILKRHN